MTFIVFGLYLCVIGLAVVVGEAVGELYVRRMLTRKAEDFYAVAFERGYTVGYADAETALVEVFERDFE